MSFNSSSNCGEEAAARCKVTVSGSDMSLGFESPTAFWALILNWYLHPGSRPLNVISGNEHRIGADRTQFGAPNFRCSTK